MATTGHTAMSVTAVARAYRSGELSPVEITQACLHQIDDIDGDIAAFATVTAERAIARARAAQAQLTDDPEVRRPLLGIPVAVKDNIDVAGVVTRGGSAALDARVPDVDATVWRRLEAAGAVLVGKTRTHELAYGVATPPTRNPVEVTRLPGGSSGGSAAAVAAGMCMGAVGTDTAGSIRIPAGLCGLVGLKPTRDLCPTDGVIPLSPTLDHVGPIARTSHDAGVLLAAMSGGAVDVHAVDLHAVDLRGVRVGVARTDALLSPEVAAALEGTIDALVGRGCAVAEETVPSFARALRQSDHIIGVEAAVVHANLVDHAGDRLQPDTRRKLRAASDIDGATYYRALRHMAEVRRGFDRALAAHDLLLAPGVACPAPEFGTGSVAVDGRVWSLGDALCWNMAAANMAGLPAVALPAGTAGGLPVGVQLIGRAGDDGRLLAVAEALAWVAAPALVEPS
ncbi:MAG TPA: amidase [Euzebyales bacterium]|nr:amidase [Euzebyales bacterium]